MPKPTGFPSLFVGLMIALSLLAPVRGAAEDAIETAGVAVGVTAGNMWFVPIKSISVVLGLTAGAMSFVLSGGNTELTRQIWEDSTRGPYLVTPEVARQSIGERPELLEKK